MINLEYKNTLVSLLAERTNTLMQEAKARSSFWLQVSSERLSNLERNREEFIEAQHLLTSIGATPLASIREVADNALFATYSALNHGIYLFQINPYSPFREIKTTGWIANKEQALKETPAEQHDFWKSISSQDNYFAAYTQEATSYTWSAYLLPSFNTDFLNVSFTPTTLLSWSTDKTGKMFRQVVENSSNTVETFSFALGNAFGFKKVPRYLHDGYYRILQAYQSEGTNLEEISTASHADYKTKIKSKNLQIDIREGERQTRGKFKVINQSLEYGQNHLLKR